MIADVIRLLRNLFVNHKMELFYLLIIFAILYALRMIIVAAKKSRAKKIRKGLHDDLGNYRGRS